LLAVHGVVAGQDVVDQLGIGGFGPVASGAIILALLQRLQLVGNGFGGNACVPRRGAQRAVAGAAEIKMVRIEQARGARDAAGQLA
jgi:hypothetical protein